ncbi:hypothetical protein BAE44_0017833 [Dichanthelium oligosanthes]|uniref:MADS-box domain-containing protein n=1 Tax=Dichanthelium oligosanthes TaxID=888268 RepID=A0A1E5V7Q6_9POAL|nr:hypothetical protein BAE44_0017833 [Dichanthelium oligosanthes]
MPRVGRRSGLRFIENDRDRSLTFFKRRSGLFKTASDLSTLTGVRVAVVLESEKERFSSFGTPDASSIVDAFLSGDAPTKFDTSEEQKAKTTNLHNEKLQLEKYKAMRNTRKKEKLEQIKAMQQTSRTAKYAYGKEEDLDFLELCEMRHMLSQVEQEINGRWSTLLHDNHVEVGGQLRDPSLLKPTWWRSMPLEVVMPPRYSPLAPSQASFQQHPWSSTAHLVQARSSSSLPNPMMLPSQQIQPKLQQHPLLPCIPSIVQLQAPPPREDYPYNYHIHGLDINGNNSHPFLLYPLSPSPPLEPSSMQAPPSNSPLPQSLSTQFSSSLHLNSRQLSFNPQHYNSMQQPQNYGNASSTLNCSHQPFYGNSLGLDAEIENTGGNGGQTFGLSTVQQCDGWTRVIPKSSSAGESSTVGDAGSNLGDLNFPWY